MTARILLVRHGRSAHPIRGWHTVDGVRAWQRAYDAAELAADDRPPPSLITVAANADLVVSSDLPRALRSAALVAPGITVVSSPLLREAEMPIPDLGSARLPLIAWSLAIGARWRYGRHRGDVPSPALREQARDAATMLTEHAGSDRTVMAVTHVTIRTLIVEALLTAGWYREPGGERYAHWGAWSMRR